VAVVTSLALVAVATGLLVLGLVGDRLALVWASFACSIGAGLVLGAAWRRGSLSRS
jgi:hypothetical protein